MPAEIAATTGPCFGIWLDDRIADHEKALARQEAKNPEIQKLRGLLKLWEEIRDRYHASTMENNETPESFKSLDEHFSLDDTTTSDDE